MLRMSLPRTVCVLFASLCFPLLAANFSVESAGPLPSADTPEAIRKLVQSEGVRVKDSQGEVAGEYWGRSEPFEGDPVSGFGIRFDNIPEGALIGVVHFPKERRDFREQTIPAGYYTMRYVLHPEDGNHMGVAPSRDFVVLTPLAQDSEPAKNYPFVDLVAMTKKVGNPHPTVLRIQLPEGDETAHLWENYSGHWVLDLQVAGDTVGIVVYGHSEE